jgi:hypothetical protein
MAATLMDHFPMRAGFPLAVLVHPARHDPAYLLERVARRALSMPAGTLFVLALHVVQVVSRRAIGNRGVDQGS